jgi:predicted nucleotidyltransferase
MLQYSALAGEQALETEELINDRARESEERLAGLRRDLSTALGAIEDRFEDPQLCIYATGSLARGEATIHSDLDAFFLLSGSRKDKAISRIRDVKILNAVVSAADTHRFPDFSNDGEFLSFLHIEDLIGQLGSRGDDYHNTFTASPRRRGAEWLSSFFDRLMREQ